MHASRGRAAISRMLGVLRGFPVRAGAEVVVYQGAPLVREAIRRTVWQDGWCTKDPVGVRDDVRQGYVSVHEAAVFYGVVIDAELRRSDAARKWTITGMS